MSEITPVTHTEKVVAGQVDAVTHFEKVIAKYGGGGGGGTSDYSQLTNKPKINNVELSDDKSLDDLGIQAELDSTQLAAVDSGITSEYVAQIETNKNNILKLNYDVHNISYLGTFANGGLNSDGTLKLEQTARVSSTNTITFPDYDVVLLADAGYAIGYIPYINGTVGTWSGWFNGKVIIPANTVLKFQITPKIYINNAQAITSDVATLTNAIKISGHNMSTIDNFITGNGSANANGDDSEPGASTLTRLITNYIVVDNIDSIIVSIASGYSYGYHSYDENFNTISNSADWVTTTTEFDLSAARYIRINVKANDNSNISPTDNIGLKIINKSIFSASDKSYNYNGIINISNSYRANNYATYTPTGSLPSTTQQGLAIFNGLAFLLYDKGGLAIYDLIRKQAIAEITLACAGTDNHCNSANFSTEIISGGAYPLLYISECYGQHRCFVENITNESSTTIQTITFANDNGDYTNSTHNNAFDWILDNDTGMLMTYGIMSDGKHKIKMFAKPNTSNATVTLHETDVVEEWIVEDNIYPTLSSNYVYQGNCAKGGIIYLLTYQSNEIICIDENTHEMTARVPLTFNTSGEPEDLAIYADTMFVVYGDKKIYGMSFD